MHSAMFFQEYLSRNPVKIYSMHLIISNPYPLLSLILSSNPHPYSLDHHRLIYPSHLYPNPLRLSLIQSSHHVHQHHISFLYFSLISCSF